MPNLTIRIEGSAKETGESQSQKDLEKAQKKQKAERMALIGVLANFAIAQGKAILSTGISQIGITTGDYIKQERIQTELGYIQDTIGIASAFLVSPLAGGLAAAAVGVKFALQINTQMKQADLENTKIDYMRSRSGNSLTNGSRTGD